MKILIDAMGGDNAPLAPLQGAAQAVQELGVEVVLVGQQPAIEAAVKENNISMQGLYIVHAPDVVSMEDDATDVVRKKPESSLAVALKMLANGEGDALVSAGSTGALLVGATLLVKRIKGIKRAAIGTVMPGGQKPWLLIDTGANVDCRPEMLVQFAAMGSAYQEKVMGVKNPTVGLANNGTEETKGTDLQLQAYPLLQNSGLNFAGNIEAREIPTGVADVVVCDGFTGNIILKLTEGVAKMFSGMIKEMMMKNLKTKLAALALKAGLTNFKKKMDYTEYGGAPLLGIKKTVIKAHGSSNSKAIKNAIRQAKICAENDVAGSIESWIAQQKTVEAEE
ncbi:phosphate acyltransferase PlsX [Ruminococcaceae bacterium OttesenSCG-928-A16]|nr:phosphate acyltransferase PlsX [Ruminococcaceae bacterium OttesenSCG-928-A16]